MKKKIYAILMIMVLALTTLAGCGGKLPENASIGNKLAAAFNEELKNTKDLQALADKLIEQPCLEGQNMATMPVEPGYLNGFENEILGFNKGVMFAPMIGSIPFVGYVFETDDADGLMAELEAQARLNWNICTEADEMVRSSSGKYVFFVMAPTSFEE